MKTNLIIVALFFSLSALAQTTLSGRTASAEDTVIDLVIVPSQAKNEKGDVPPNYRFQMATGSSKAGMNGIFLVMTLLALFMLTNKLNRDSLKDI
jgi:hypothetical protein